MLSLLIFVIFARAWQMAPRGGPAGPAMDREYAKLMSANATQGKSAMPGPLDVGAKLIEHPRHPFCDKGPHDKGLGSLLAFSMMRVAAG